MLRLILYLKYHLWPIRLYKLNFGSNWCIGTKDICEQEREKFLNAGWHQDDIAVSTYITTNAALVRSILKDYKQP